jgi:hypothetical protein
MSKFKLAFDTKNEAFDDDAYLPEITRILRDVARQVEENGLTSGSIKDSNGNTIGDFKADEPELSTGYRK